MYLSSYHISFIPHTFQYQLTQYSHGIIVDLQKKVVSLIWHSPPNATSFSIRDDCQRLQVHTMAITRNHEPDNQKATMVRTWQLPVITRLSLNYDIFGENLIQTPPNFIPSKGKRSIYVRSVENQICVSQFSNYKILLSESRLVKTAETVVRVG